MIRIAICDDDDTIARIILIQTQKFFKNKEIEFKIDVYNKSPELLNNCLENNYDLLLLDIDMPQLSGFDVSAQLRKNDITTTIIFISGRENFVFRSIKYSPFRFIRKGCLEDELNEALNDFLIFFTKKNVLCDFNCENCSLSLPLNKITYFESFSHSIFINTIDKATFKLNRKYNLKCLESDFIKHGFIRVHKSYLVNFRFIKVIKETDIILTNDVSIPSTKNRIGTVKEQYKSLIMEDL